MNLENYPTKEQLAELLKKCDDEAGHHIVWVDDTAEVHVSVLPDGMTPIQFGDETAGLRFRLPTLQWGNDYVGPDVAADDGWVSQLFESLVKRHGHSKTRNGLDYYDVG